LLLWLLFTRRTVGRRLSCMMMKQKTQHTITNDNNNDNKVKIFSRVKISFCRKDTHTTKRI
jgi:hypothetical protein